MSVYQDILDKAHKASDRLTIAAEVKLEELVKSL